MPARQPPFLQQTRRALSPPSGAKIRGRYPFGESPAQHWNAIEKAGCAGQRYRAALRWWGSGRGRRALRTNSAAVTSWTGPDGARSCRRRRRSGCRLLRGVECSYRWRRGRIWWSWRRMSLLLSPLKGIRVLSPLKGIRVLSPLKGIRVLSPLKGIRGPAAKQKL